MDVGYYEIDSLRRENFANKNTQLTEESVILTRRPRRKLFKGGLRVIKKDLRLQKILISVIALISTYAFNSFTKYIIIL